MRMMVCLTNFHNIFNNIFCQLLNVHVVNDVRQIEMHTAKPLVLEPSFFDAEIATDKL
jgi:hypothetical protein